MTTVEANKAQRRNLLRHATKADLQDAAKFWDTKLKRAERERQEAQTELAEILLELQERKL